MSASQPIETPLSAGWGDDPSIELDPSVHSVEGESERVHHTLAQKATTDYQVRCRGEITRGANTLHPTTKVCGKLLANIASRPWEIKCYRCSTVNHSPEGSFPASYADAASPEDADGDAWDSPG